LNAISFRSSISVSRRDNNTARVRHVPVLASNMELSSRSTCTNARARFHAPRALTNVAHCGLHSTTVRSHECLVRALPVKGKGTGSRKIAEFQNLLRLDGQGSGLSNESTLPLSRSVWHNASLANGAALWWRKGDKSVSRVIVKIYRFLQNLSSISPKSIKLLGNGTIVGDMMETQ
jgi:hypothetical protein